MQQLRARLHEITEELVTIKNEFEDMQCNEQMKFDNLPESLQESERGDTFQDNIEEIEDIISNIEDAIFALE